MSVIKILQKLYQGIKRIIILILHGNDVDLGSEASLITLTSFNSA